MSSTYVVECRKEDNTSETGRGKALLDVIETAMIEDGCVSATHKGSTRLGKTAWVITFALLWSDYGDAKTRVMPLPIRWADF